MREILEWYVEKAEAIARYLSNKEKDQSEAVLAVVTELQLDGGKRGRNALSVKSGWPKKGDKMKFLDRNGYDYQLKVARQVFTPGQIVTVKSIEVEASKHWITFEEVAGEFNGVMFEWL